MPRVHHDDLDPATAAAFAAALDHLRALPFDPKAGPAAVGLDPAAKGRFRALCREVAATAEGIDGGPMSAALPNAARLALRLALVWHCVACAADRRDPRAGPIGDKAMWAGEVRAQWFVGEAERVYAMLAERPEDRSARPLAEWVRRKGGRVTPRDLQRSNRKYGSSEEAEAALDALVTAGLGRWDGPRPTGGRPAGRVCVLGATPSADGRPKPTEGAGADGTAPGPAADEWLAPPPVNLETVGEIAGVSACVGRRPDAGGSEPVADPALVAPTLLSSATSPSHPLTTGETTQVAPEPVTRSPSSRAWPRVGDDDRPPRAPGVRDDDNDTLRRAADPPADRGADGRGTARRRPPVRRRGRRRRTGVRADLPANLAAAVRVLHTGLRALLTGWKWLGCGSTAETAAPVVLTPAFPIPPWVTLLAVEGDRSCDRIGLAARSDLPHLFALVPGPSERG